MANVRLTWQNNSSGHDGQRVRMDAPSSEGPDTVIADLGPAVEEYIALDATEPEACFTVAAYGGGGEEESGEACVETGSGETDWGSVSIGDYVEGGVYAGIDNIGGVDYHIISGDASSEVGGLRWKTSNTTTVGTGSDADGLANTQAMEAAGITEHPAAEHCVNYAGGGHNDWHMPARSQVSLMYSNLAGHAEFASNVGSGDYTWTSTERASSTAWVFQFAGAGESFNLKNNPTQRVRPIRRVPV